MHFEKMKELAFWSKFLGWTTLIMGILNAVTGVFAFVIGAVPGLIMVYMGWKLIQASKNSEELYKMGQNQQTLNELLNNYYQFFKVQGILMILVIIFMLIYFALLIILFMSVGIFST